MSSDIKLLPCPCCGSEAKIGILEKHFTFYRAVCLECGLTAKATPTPELTASLWNTRKPMEHYKLGNCTNDCEHFDNAVTYGYTKAIDGFFEKIMKYCSMSNMNATMIRQIAEQLKEGAVDG